MPVAMSQLPGYDTYSLGLLVRCAAILNLFNFDAWKRKQFTANTKQRLLQQGVQLDAGAWHTTPQIGQAFALEMLHLLAAFHTRRAEMNAKELCTLLWSLGSAAKVDTTVSNMLAFQDDGHASILTQAVAMQAAAVQKVSEAAQSLSSGTLP
ncbi:hypothetical protein DUNSADRAFT_14180 [Dunaliella salina]|uniref:Uncharacterized protein n=1 Tax=Dunaliella salina TaxID=3046 RepID=A0ABQ7G7X0_DUNSA|nr:hypothetical protein DUNSADRAFT_14180 [Dunaliella salina]|eukprot:KAF5830694.1 hypothetical protein DUNSADRAFT_14180 [Dunaliella salina]